MTLWYMTRGTGVVALVLLTGSLLLGIVEVKRWSSERWPRFVTAALHRNLSLLSVAFIGVHITTSVVDGFAPIGWLDAVIPFHSPYRPLWLGLGAVATDLLIAVAITSLLRGRLGYGAWKAVHWASYACWPVAVLHGMGTGTDTKLGWVVLLNVAALVAVAAAVLWRVGRRVGSSVVGAGAAVSSVLVPVAIVAFLLAGPLKPGWSRRAGTPASILSKNAVSAAAPAPAAGAQPAAAPASAAADPFSSGFRDSLAGSLAQNGGTVTINGSLSGDVAGALRVILQGTPSPGGGIEMTSSSATLGPTSNPQLYTGSVSGLEGTRMLLSFSGPAGRALTVSVRLNIDGSAVSGTVVAR